MTLSELRKNVVFPYNMANNAEVYLSDNPDELKTFFKVLSEHKSLYSAITLNQDKVVGYLI